ncbi:4140_t:CDS:2 [Rhizophagus irregularis]|nr:4140_t:CDS:2 [Rhizophagus irregularis]
MNAKPPYADDNIKPKCQHQYDNKPPNVPNPNHIAKPPSVLYRYHKTPIHVSSNIKSAYDFPLGIYNPTNPTAIQQIETDNYYIEDIRKDNKPSKGGLFGTLRRKKRNNRKNISIGASNRNSVVYGYEDEGIRRYSV